MRVESGLFNFREFYFYLSLSPTSDVKGNGSVPSAANCLQFSGVNSQGLKNRCGNLRCRYRRLDHLRGNTWIGNDEPHVRVTKAEATVLGILRLGSSVNRAVNRLHDDVRSARVAHRVFELEGEFVAGHDVFNEQFRWRGG